MTQLNDQQEIAVNYFDSPLLILAGAGAGKTETTKHLMRYLAWRSEKISSHSNAGKAAAGKPARSALSALGGGRNVAPVPRRAAQPPQRRYLSDKCQSSLALLEKLCRNPINTTTKLPAGVGTSLLLGSLTIPKGRLAAS